MWGLVWLLYLSFVNVGQTFYGFGWETLLLESGFLAIFLGGSATTPSMWLVWMYRWLLFRVMFGAGLIKIRGDSCWRDLTCLNYYFETQPIPNPLSWRFHWLPHAVHKAWRRLQSPRRTGGAVWLLRAAADRRNCGAVHDGVPGRPHRERQPVLAELAHGRRSVSRRSTTVSCRGCPIAPPTLHEPALVHRGAIYALAAVVAVLSVAPTLNMLSASQMMNTSFEPFHLVNTYGAFGSITRARYEIVIEGTDDQAVTEPTKWREYEFKGKPGDPARRPPQIAPVPPSSRLVDVVRSVRAAAAA